MEADRPICRTLFKHAIACPRAFALPTVGKRRAARIAMMAMTTKSSMSVNAAELCVLERGKIVKDLG